MLLPTNAYTKLSLPFILDGSLQRLPALPNMFSVDSTSLATTTQKTLKPTRKPDNSTLSKRPEESSDKVLTKGGAAGLAIGMLLLGLIIGVVGTILFKKHKPLDEIAFKKHEEPAQSSQAKPNETQLSEVHTNSV